MQGREDICSVPFAVDSLEQQDSHDCSGESRQKPVDYPGTNAVLKALYEERMQRSQDRRWNSPEQFYLSNGQSPLLLCSLPGRYLGAQVWLSGHLLARFLASGRCQFLPLTRAVRCLELGAGLGVVGLAAAAVGAAAEVVLTDKAEMLPLLRHNIQINQLSERCRAEQLDWGKSPRDWGTFDIVLAADVIYPTKDPTSLFALRDTIFALCEPGSSTTLVLAYHPRAHEDREFLEHELLPHFSILSKDDVVDDVGTGAPTSCQVYACQRKSVADSS